MEKNNLIVGAIGIAVCVILIGGLFMPAIETATDSQRTIVNNTASGKFSNFYGEDLENLVAEIELSDYSELGFNVTINGNSYFVGATARESMVMSDRLFVRADPRNSGVNVSFASMESSSEAITTATLPLVVTITGSTISVKDAGTIDITESNNNWVFIPDSSGDYELVASDSTTPIYLNGVEQVYISTYINTNDLGWISGNGSELTFIKTGVKTNVVLTDFEKDERYTDLITGLAGNVDINPEAGTNPDGSAFTPFFVMIPRTIDAHTEQNDMTISLFNVMPVIVIISLIVAASYWGLGRKY